MCSDGDQGTIAVTVKVVKLIYTFMLSLCSNVLYGACFICLLPIACIAGVSVNLKHLETLCC